MVAEDWYRVVDREDGPGCPGGGAEIEVPRVPAGDVLAFVGSALGCRACGIAIDPADLVGDGFQRNRYEFAHSDAERFSRNDDSDEPRFVYEYHVDNCGACVLGATPLVFETVLVRARNATEALAWGHLAVSTRQRVGIDASRYETWATVTVVDEACDPNDVYDAGEFEALLSF